MGPYRTNSYQPYRPSWWDTYGWRLLEDVKTVIAVALVILIIAGSIVSLAYGLQYVVTGFVGHPVGSFGHYAVGIILFGWAKAQLKRD